MGSIHIIDLTQTLELTNVALEKIYDVIKNNGKILFISTKKQASEAISEIAKSTGQYFVNYRWLGGMLTNWGTISNSIKKIQKIPDLVFVIDTNYESLAIKESIKLGIPIIAILDTNSNPEGIDFPIPGNDDARRSIDLYCSLIKETINN